MQHRSGRSADRKRVRLWNRMSDIDEIDGKGTDRQVSAGRHDLDRNFRRTWLGSSPRLEQCRGKRGGMDRHFQPRPQVDQRAHMVLVAMGKHQREDVSALFDEIADVGQDEIDAREMLLRGEGHAAIDDDPLPPAIVAEAVDREVHPDLADAAQGCEYKLVVRHAALARLAGDGRAAAHGEGKHVASRYCLDTAVLNFKHQVARLIEANKAALHFGLAVAHSYVFADAARMGQPIAENGGEAPATIPLRDPAAHRGGQPGKQLLRRYCRAMRPQIGCRETAAAVSGQRMTAAIDADANDDNEAFPRVTVRGRLDLEENALAFERVKPQDVRAFERQLLPK